MAPCRYILKRIAKRWRPNNVITSIGLGFTIFSLVSSDKFFVVIYTFIFGADYWFLLLTEDIFSIWFKKDKKKKQISKNEMKHSEKSEFIKERWCVTLLNFRPVPGPTFKLWGESQVPGSWGPGSRAPGPTFTPIPTVYTKKRYQQFSLICLFPHLQWQK